MNKLTIPAIMVATIMVAGVFAFMPVEQASTVHTSAAFESASLVRTQTTLDLTLTQLTGTGHVTFGVDADDGVFQIKQLLLCDSAGSGRIHFSVNTAVTGIGTGNMLNDNDNFLVHTLNVGEDLCTDVLANVTDGVGGDGAAGLIQLRGDGDNDVVLVFRNYANDPDDSLILVAYVSGISDANDIDITLDLGDFDRP